MPITDEDYEDVTILDQGARYIEYQVDDELVVREEWTPNLVEKEGHLWGYGPENAGYGYYDWGYGPGIGYGTAGGPARRDYTFEWTPPIYLTAAALAAKPPPQLEDEETEFAFKVPAVEDAYTYGADLVEIWGLASDTENLFILVRGESEVVGEEELGHDLVLVIDPDDPTTVLDVIEVPSDPGTGRALTYGEVNGVPSLVVAANRWAEGGYWDSQWVPGYWEEVEVWHEGWWESVWVEGAWVEVWVPGWMEEYWVEGYYEWYWVEGYYEEYWVPGYWAPWGWEPGHWESYWVDGYYEEVWVPGYWEQIWHEGYWEYYQEPGYWDYIWYEGWWETESYWVEGYWEYVWVPGVAELEGSDIIILDVSDLDDVEEVYLVPPQYPGQPPEERRVTTWDLVVGGLAVRDDGRIVATESQYEALDQYFDFVVIDWSASNWWIDWFGVETGFGGEGAAFYDDPNDIDDGLFVSVKGKVFEFAPYEDRMMWQYQTKPISPNPADLGDFDLTGLTIGDEELYQNLLYLANNNDGSIYKSSITPQEEVVMLADGQYEAEVLFSFSDEITETKTFWLDQMTQEGFQINVTEPEETPTFVKTKTVTFTGTLTDPAVDEVSLLGAERELIVFEDDMEGAEKWKHYSLVGDGTQPDPTGWRWDIYNYDEEADLWHLSDERANSGDESWRYADEEEGNYDTGTLANAGALELKKPVKLGTDNTLRFWTWYQADDWWVYDKQFVEISDTYDENAEEWIDWEPIAQLVGWEEWGVPSEVAELFVIVPPNLPPMEPWDMDMGYMPPEMMMEMPWQEVEIDIPDEYNDKKVSLRFRFDTISNWMNRLEGWYIDDVELTSVTVKEKDLTVTDQAFSGTFPVDEGLNEIRVYAECPYNDEISEELLYQVYLDTESPDVSLEAGAPSTTEASRTVLGRVDELKVDTVVMELNEIEVLSLEEDDLLTFAELGQELDAAGLMDVDMLERVIYWLGGVPPEEPEEGWASDQAKFDAYAARVDELEGQLPEIAWFFWKIVSLIDGENEIEVTATDLAGNDPGVASATIVKDTLPPTITVKDTSYPLGQISARPGDTFVLSLYAVDAGSGIDYVELLPPNWEEGPPADYPEDEPWPPRFKRAWDAYWGEGGSEVPEAILDGWGVPTDANFMQPMVLPPGLTEGSYAWTVVAYDNGGLSSTAEVAFEVTTDLKAFNIYLMPGYNLISLPLVPDKTKYDDWDDTLLQIVNLTKNVKGENGAAVIKAIHTYDATETDLPQAQRWHVFYPDDVEHSDLLEMLPGSGFWALTDPAAFGESKPLAAGIPPTPAPVKFTIYGSFLKPGPGEVPPEYEVVEGWNLIGFHSENPRVVTDALATVTWPDRIWASLVEYNNYIKFELGERPEARLGVFKTLSSTDDMNPGYGFWLYIQKGYSGTIVP